MSLLEESGLKPFVRSLPIPLAVLTAAWIWARLALAHFQKIEGFVGIGASSRADHYHFWALTVPEIAACCGFAVWGIGLIVLGIRRRSWIVLPAVIGLAPFLLFALMIIFVDFKFEAFN